MTIWKKLGILLVMFLQIIVGAVVIMLWVYREQVWTIPLNDWLHSPLGQQFSAVIAAFLVVVGASIAGWTLYHPTTTEQIVIALDDQQTAIVDRSTIEHRLRTAIAKYDLYNPAIKLALHRQQASADVAIHGMLSHRTNASLLKRTILHTVEHQLKQDFNLELNELRVNLRPYQRKKPVKLIFDRQNAN